MFDVVFKIIKIVITRVLFSYLMKIGFILLVIVGLGTGVYYLFG